MHDIITKLNFKRR